MTSTANALMLDHIAQKENGFKIGRQQMPLTFLKSGEEATVLKVRGKGEAHHHLENLGFVQGAHLKMISEQGGNIIVEIKGSHVALDGSIASKVITN